MSLMSRIIHFIVLACILALGTWVFLQFPADPSTQLTVGIITSILYILWGIIHHQSNGDLHKKVVVEYILVGAVAIVLMVIILRT